MNRKSTAAGIRNSVDKSGVGERDLRREKWSVVLLTPDGHKRSNKRQPDTRYSHSHCLHG